MLVVKLALAAVVGVIAGFAVTTLVFVNSTTSPSTLKEIEEVN